jgi:hypothetical protein
MRQHQGTNISPALVFRQFPEYLWKSGHRPLCVLQRSPLPKGTPASRSTPGDRKLIQVFVVIQPISAKPMRIAGYPIVKESYLGNAWANN